MLVHIKDATGMGMDCESVKTVIFFKGLHYVDKKTIALTVTSQCCKLVRHT